MGISLRGRPASALIAAVAVVFGVFVSSSDRAVAEPDGAGVPSASAAAAAATADPTRAAMHELLGALRTLLPQAVAGELGDPERKEQQAAALALLGSRAEALSTHGSPLPSGSRLLATALAEDARRAETFFQRGRHDTAGFLVARMVDDCTSCH